VAENLLQREGGKPELLTQAVDARGDVPLGVDEGAVQVEEDGAEWMRVCRDVASAD
jgi:hypothetical protein